MLKLESISKYYPNRNRAVISNLDLEIRTGESLAIMGKSGSGKTTLLSILGLLDRPNQGKYILGGIEVNGLNQKKSAVLRNEIFGFVFQSHFLISHYTLLENCAMPLYYRKVSIKKARQLAKMQLESIGLKGLENRYPHQISGGQQQRVAIARALVGSPKVILADEPTSALDKESKNQVLNLLFSLQKDHGFTLVMVTHDFDTANYCQRIFELRDDQ